MREQVKGFLAGVVAMVRFPVITNRGHLWFRVFIQRFTSPVFPAFLRRLVRTGRLEGTPDRGEAFCALVGSGHHIAPGHLPMPMHISCPY